MRTALLLPLLLLLAACATAPNPAPSTAENDAEFIPKYPAVSLYFKTPSEQLASDCESFRKASLLQHCTENLFSLPLFRASLQREGAFEHIAVAQEGPQYELLISTALFDRESGAEIGNEALSGATLKLLPSVKEKTLRSEVVISWNELPIQLYSYEIPVKQSVSLFSGGYDSHKQLTELVSDQLLQDLERDAVFSGRHLLSAIGASDYDKDLVVPGEVGGYFFEDRYIYNNPFHGTQLSFQHKLFAFDKAEVFVYPVRNIDWSDAATITNAEAEILQTELLSLSNQGHIASIELSDIQPLTWQVQNNVFEGVFFDGLVTDHNGGQATTANYIFTKGDKFIRVRASFPVVEGSAEVDKPDQFVRALLEEVVPPQESEFMSNIRQRRREMAMYR